MPKRTRIVNDPADLVPLLQVFGTEKHKKVLDELSVKWSTENDLNEALGYDSKESLEILKRAGLLENNWKMPNPGETPDKEYHSSYSRVITNFQCSFQDLGDMIMIAFMNENEIKKIADVIVDEISNGKRSMSNLCRTLDLSPTFLRGIAHKSQCIVVKGQRIELLKEPKRPQS